MTAPQDYTYCVITANRPTGKIFTPDLEKTPLTISGGRADVYVGTIAEIRDVVASLTPSQCLTTGLPAHDSAILTTARQEVPGRTQDGLPVIARTNQNWSWPDEPGLLAFDHDPDHWTYEPLETIQAVVDKIGKALGISMSEFDYLALPSSSSNIWLDGEEVVGLKGVHVYLGVENLSHVDGDALMALAFQNGLGCGVVSRSGSILKRTVFDSALHKAPAQPIFAGPPTFEGRHVSRREVICNEGRSLDLRSIQGTVREAEAAAAWDAVRSLLGGKARTAFEAYCGERERDGITRAAVDGAIKGELPGKWPIVFDDGTTIPIWKIMANPGQYAGRTDVRDPLEPEYGTSKAIIYAEADRVTIHSQAHGGQTFTCYNDADTLLARIQDDPKLKEGWAALVGSVGGSSTADEVVDALVEAGVDETKRALKERVRRIMRQAAHTRAQAAGDKWASEWAYLASSNRFLKLHDLNQHCTITTYGAQAFDTVNALDGGPAGEPPSKWLVGKTKVIPEYGRIVYTPPQVLGGSLPIVEGALNAWRPGPKITRVTAEPTLWLDLVKHLVPAPDQREVFLNWMAFALQFPGVKCNWQVLMQSVEGMGKDTMLLPLRWGVGQHNARDVTTDELLERFEHYLVGGPKLLILQELDAAHKAQTRTKLKPLAAAPPTAHTVDQKNEKPIYVDNYQAIIVLTNKAHPFALDKGDRRWYMLQAAGQPWRPEQFKALHGWYASGGLRQVAGWLAARDLSSFDHNVLPPNTPYKQQVIDMSATSYYMVVEELVEGKQAVTLEWVIRSAAMQEERVTHKQAITTMQDLGWAPRQVSKRIGDRVAKYRAWMPSGCMLGDSEIYEIVSKLVSYG